MDHLLYGCAYYDEYMPYDRIETDFQMMEDAGMNIIRKKMEAKGTPLAEPAGCLAGDCAHCGAACPSAQKTATKEASEGGDK